ncbi:MAG: sugar phosphate isomerase/epimerase [Rhodospirillales bacterium]|nr:sugar phosphate isomerase/epimerase [Rhodospirillales bacterium]
MGTIISVSTAIFDGYDLDTALEELAKAGATHVEPAYIRGYMGTFTEEVFSESAAAAMRRKLKDLGLGCLALSCHMDLNTPESIDILKGRMVFAKNIGARFVNTNSAKHAEKAQFMTNMEELSRFAEEIDVTIGLENPGHGAGDLLPCGAEAVALLKEIGSPNVRMNFDAGNTYTYNHGKVDVASDFEAILPMTDHLHLKDMVDTGDGWTFCGIGKGVIDWKAVLAVATGRSPTLPLGLEIPMRIHRPGYDDPVRLAEPLPLDTIRDEVRDSLDFTQGLLAELEWPAS